MPYDALGNYIPGDDEPSLDQMRLALTQKQPTYTQIPGYDRPVPQADRPLDRATRDLKSIATNMNPLMLMKIPAMMNSRLKKALQSANTLRKSAGIRMDVRSFLFPRKKIINSRMRAAIPGWLLLMSASFR